MQPYALTIDKFLDHAGKWFGIREVVSAGNGETTTRRTYVDVRERSNRLSGALAELGIGPGDRVGTLAWNTLHHFEVYFAVMGMGAVCHTLNPRLTPAQLAAMVNEAEDKALAVAADLVPLARQVIAHCPGVRALIVLDGDAAAHQEVETVDLEQLLAARGAPYCWGAFDETCEAGLCYTSGTTGSPKGVIYTHRSNYLHTLRALQADAIALKASDALLLAVPMFHANGWGLPFAAPAVGANLVLPGRDLDGATLAHLIRGEGVTVAVGVQTVWLGLADHLDRTGEDVPSLERVVIGGSNCPEALIRRLEDRLGARVQTSWGMTELSPIGTISPPDAGAVQGTSGRPPVGIDLKLTDASGVTLPEQRGVQGHLKVRGASVVDRYLGATDDALDAEGYFDTGDLATIDADGNLSICGRAKDLIKSGGEWINPAEIEALIGRNPAVRHVAVVARPHPKWGERPVMIVECDAGIEPRSLLAVLEGKVPGWWLPDEVICVPAMPLAATGKIDKAMLRTEFGGSVDRAA